MYGCTRAKMERRRKQMKKKEQGIKRKTKEKIEEGEKKNLKKINRRGVRECVLEEACGMLSSFHLYGLSFKEEV